GADRLVESSRDLLRDGFGLVRPRQQHEIVPADVSDEALVGPRGVHHDLRQHRDDAVATREPVVIVELLEAVDVDVEERKILAARQTRFELFGDGWIAGQTRQRVDAPQPARATDRRPDPRQQLVRVVWLGYEILGAGL